MGSRSVKQKPKQKKTVSAEQYTLFTDVMSSFAAVTTEKMLQLDERTKNLNTQAMKDFTLTTDTLMKINNRLTAIEDGIKQQHYTVNVGQVSQDLINELKNAKPNPVTVSTPQHTCNHKEEMCRSIFNSVKNALRKLKNLNFVLGTTMFCVKIPRNNYARVVQLDVHSGYVIMSYYNRAGVYKSEQYTKASEASAAMSALCMYYALV